MSKADQLLLDLGGAPSLTREDLIVTPANVAAASLVDIWPEWPGHYAVLIGPKGCGKTHLANIWKDRANAHQLIGGKICDVDLDQAQQGRPILIDGLKLEELNETKLFHLMNAVRNAKSSMLITASTAPEHWPIHTPDLMSRIKLATSITIAEPDDALFAAVVVKLFADRQITIEPTIVDYIVMHTERSLGAANQLVESIDKRALANNKRITKPLVKQVLDEQLVGQTAF